MAHLLGRFKDLELTRLGRTRTFLNDLLDEQLGPAVSRSPLKSWSYAFYVHMENAREIYCQYIPINPGQSLR